MRTGDDCRLLNSVQGCDVYAGALARGVPDVSLVVELPVQRFPLRAYRTMGVGSAPLARTREEYVADAVRFGRELDCRRALTDELVKRRELFSRESRLSPNSSTSCRKRSNCSIIEIHELYAQELLATS